MYSAARAARSTAQELDLALVVFFFDRSSSSPAIRDSNWGAGYAVACSNTINGGGHSGGSAGGQGEGGGGVDGSDLVLVAGSAWIWLVKLQLSGSLLSKELEQRRK